MTKPTIAMLKKVNKQSLSVPIWATSYTELGTSESRKVA